MRVVKFLAISLICISLTACVSSLLLGNKAQSKLMWAFLKPLVGFDPNEVDLFESPMIKNRMTQLLGTKYEPTMKLLRTAQKIQQEGVLFYVTSSYAPPKVKEITDKASMIWNADTNQMAVMLIQDGKAEIISEQMDKAKQAITPVLPTEVKTVYDQAIAAKQKMDSIEDIVESSKDPLGTLQDTANKKIEEKVLEEKTE